MRHDAIATVRNNKIDERTLFTEARKHHHTRNGEICYLNQY